MQFLCFNPSRFLTPSAPLMKPQICVSNLTENTFCTAATAEKQAIECYNC